jgi:cytidine deaminase
MDMAELTDDDLELIAKAEEAINANADVEGGVHTVGAAVRDAAGRIHVGVNVYHFSGGPCAELVALGTARTSGARELTAIVAVGDSGRGVKAPCGRDRQILADYHPNIRVIVPTPLGVRNVAIDDLLPLGFDWLAEEKAAADRMACPIGD